MKGVKHHGRKPTEEPSRPSHRHRRKAGWWQRLKKLVLVLQLGLVVARIVQLTKSWLA
ncbi:hypothetical protein [Streptomyces sp. NPDC047042]|uniref:hypothetical protein n=1 Tax=Streptomyces sp. NPDC047042 TaxID=3154807 RepID=UPI0033FB25AC